MRRSRRAVLTNSGADAGRRTLEANGLADATFVSAHSSDVTGAAHAGMRTAFVLRDEPWASAYPRPGVEATSLPGIAAALSLSVR